MLAVLGLATVACTGREPVTPSRAASATPRPSATATTPNAAASGAVRPMRSGPPPKDIGCDDIIAAKSPPYPDPTLPPPPAMAINGGDAASRAAIERGTAALAKLRSYRFSVDVIGRDIATLQASTFDFAIQGTLDRSNDLVIDAVLGSRIREADGSAAVSSGGQRFMVGHGFVWGTDNVSGDPEPRRDPSTVAVMGSLTPEGNAARYVTPFAAGYILFDANGFPKLKAGGSGQGSMTMAVTGRSTTVIVDTAGRMRSCKTGSAGCSTV